MLCGITRESGSYLSSICEYLQSHCLQFKVLKLVILMQSSFRVEGILKHLLSPISWSMLTMDALQCMSFKNITIFGQDVSTWV